MTTVTISANATISDNNVIINEETIKVISNDKFREKIKLYYDISVERDPRNRDLVYSELVNGYLTADNMFISFISKKWVYFISVGGKLFYFHNKKDTREPNDKINVIKFDSVEEIYCNSKPIKESDYNTSIYALFGDPRSKKELLAVLNTLVSTPTI